ncbi:MAG: hypothetical protein AABX11_00865 [Nanoarchaeota archaeon]
MNLPFDFEYYLKKKIARKVSPNFSRAEFLFNETKKSFIGLKDRVDKLGINEFNANSIIKDIHDIIIEKIRAKVLIEGYSCSGNFAHEAEIAYMKNLGFTDYELSFINQLRQSRNGINYYGKIYEKSYAGSCYKFLTEINNKLDFMFSREIIPKLKFYVVDNPDEMIRLINGFLLYSGKSFNWSRLYSKEYPEFGKLIEKVQNPEEIKKISNDFFKKLYYDKLKELEKIAKSFQIEWDKEGEQLLRALSKIVEKEWLQDWKEMKAWVSLNPICPRFIEQRAFDIYWKAPPDKMKSTALHEILHFIWF